MGLLVKSSDMYSLARTRGLPMVAAGICRSRDLFLSAVKSVGERYTCAAVTTACMHMWSATATAQRNLTSSRFPLAHREVLRFCM
jgi:hypothetical protein